MSTLADYIALHDGSITLSRDQEHTFEFNLPSNTSLGDGDTRFVLSFMIDPSGSTDKNYDIDVNDVRVNDFTVSHGEPRAVTEIINGSKFTVNGENTIQFRMESGTGSIAISDVVLWFQRNYPNL